MITRKLFVNFGLLMVVVLLLIFPSSAQDVTAKPTTSSVTINNEDVAFMAYNIEGYNYFKLRDLAMALNNSNKKFSVTYNAALKKISLSTGSNYVPSGDELIVGSNMQNKSVRPTKQSLYCNDVKLSMTAYNIDGSNYFKLRDIMQILNISVNWDGANNAITLDTNKPYVYAEGILTGTTLPPLKVVGNWPVTEKTLQTVWARSYPLYANYLGLPTKILNEGISWIWDESITPDTVGYYPELNAMKMGPLPYFNHFNPTLNENYEELYLLCMHETGHLFWQVNDKNLEFDFGQWIWEGHSLIAETLYKLDYYNQWLEQPDYDLKAYLGKERVNGVMSDGNKYSGAGRNMVDDSATKALVMLTSVLSHNSGYDYMARVNAERVKEYERTGDLSISARLYGEILDRVANGKLIDGMKPSQWLFAQPVANTSGKDGAFLTIVPFYPNFNMGDVSTGKFILKTALFERLTNVHGDKVEETLVGIPITFKLFDSSGTLLTQKEQTTTSEEDALISLALPKNMSEGVYRVTAEAVIDSKLIDCTTYFVFTSGGLSENQIAVLLVDKNGKILNDIGPELSVTGGTTVDKTKLSKGLVIISTSEGQHIKITLSGQQTIISKSYGTRIVPITMP